MHVDGWGVKYVFCCHVVGQIGHATYQYPRLPARNHFVRSPNPTLLFELFPLP